MGRPGLIWRGEVHYVDLGQPVGHEPAFRRPAVAVSVNIRNNGPGALVVVVPITTASYGLPSHVELEPEGGGLDQVAYARCDQLRVVSIERLSFRHSMIAPDQCAPLTKHCALSAIYDRSATRSCILKRAVDQST
ncbi:type II toxin-antitoxin system PemK/MazF family toxin [Mycobacterium decipiens]|uniref:type II toxin-antitoxin system PemK/MazF family toxin n=1 Tax=Mycobacterium decipiens TaxID=1430326 RepID=UPI001F6014EF|nr:type II toxin-antitoxin system PemK/MazF family toxin [Mycobacterium decipiens]